MRKLFFVISAMALVIMGGCRKPYEYMEPKITETSATIKQASINSLSVDFSVAVNFAGEKEMKVEISQNDSFVDSQIFTMSQYSTYKAYLNVKNLVLGCKYYYRFIISTPSFSLTSETKSFKITEIHLFYGYGGHSSNLGNSSHDFSIEWAVMFPAFKLVPFEGSSITKVQAYIGAIGSYTLKIYKGGSSSPSTLLLSKSFEASSGWTNIEFPPIDLDVNSSLWVSLYTSQTAGHYPLSYGYGADDINARWIKVNETWMDGKDWAGGSTICWLIKAFITQNAKDCQELKIELPLTPIE